MTYEAAQTGLLNHFHQWFLTPGVFKAYPGIYHF